MRAPIFSTLVVVAIAMSAMCSPIVAARIPDLSHELDDPKGLNKRVEPDASEEEIFVPVDLSKRKVLDDAKGLDKRVGSDASDEEIDVLVDLSKRKVPDVQVEEVHVIDNLERREAQGATISVVVDLA